MAFPWHSRSVPARRPKYKTFSGTRHYANTVVGRVPIQVDYSDYRPVAGVQMPFGFYYTWVSQREVWTLTDYQANVSIDAAKFGRPANQSAAR